MRRRNKTDGFDQVTPTEPQPGDVPQKYCAYRLPVLEQDASTKLHLAARLGIHSVSVRKLWQGALQRAPQSGVAVLRDPLCGTG
jgi:hypothetical protein